MISFKAARCLNFPVSTLVSSYALSLKRLRPKDSSLLQRIRAISKVFSSQVLIMKLLPLLSLLWLPSLALAAKRSRGDRFEEFHSLAVSSTPLKLDDGVYDELTATPRNYSAAVLLTALQPQFGCNLCREVQPEWELLARSWVKGDRAGASRVVFGTLDFSNGKGTFQRVRDKCSSCLACAHVSWAKRWCS